MNSKVPEVLVSFQQEESKGQEASDFIDVDQLNTNGNYQDDNNSAVIMNESLQDVAFLQNRMDNNSLVQSDSLLIDGAMKGSFEKYSLIEPSHIQSLIGSLVMQEGEGEGAYDVKVALNSAQTAQEG